MYTNIMIGLFFTLFFVSFFYLFRFSARKIVSKHTAGKMDIMYKLWIICGCVAMILSLFMFIKTIKFVNNAKLIRGEVVQLIELHKMENRTCFTPVFSYKNSENIEMQMKSKTCVYPPIFSVGDKVDLLFNGDPNDSPIEDEWFALWGGSLILGGLGILFFILGSLGMFFRKKNQERQLGTGGIR